MGVVGKVDGLTDRLEKELPSWRTQIPTVGNIFDRLAGQNTPVDSLTKRSNGLSNSLVFIV